MRKIELVGEQKTAMDVARIAFMTHCPFFAHYFYSEMEEFPTKDFPPDAPGKAMTDGRRIYYDPDFMVSLKPQERVFVLAHEVYHVISRHPTRMKHYCNEGHLRGLPYSSELFNTVADYIINADLVKQNIGICNPAWLYDPSISPEELVEDLYEKMFKKMPSSKSQPKSGASGDGKSGPQLPDVSTYGGNSRGGKPDPNAVGGRFDSVLPPQVDPVTGKEDLPSEAEFKEAIARAAAAAKSMGKMPAGFQRLVNEILEPQVDWRDHIRMLITGKVGVRHETWDRPNRRRLALSRGDVTKVVILPGRRGYGANDVAVVIDSSGSIGDRELAVFFAEIGSIMQDVRPKNIHVVHCDAAVHQVDVVSSLDEVTQVRNDGVKGGGGTDFRPPFKWLADNGVRPECLVYLTDMYGEFPDEAPLYPVIWCATTGAEAPWGEVVRIKI